MILDRPKQQKMRSVETRATACLQRARLPVDGDHKEMLVEGERFVPAWGFGSVVAERKETIGLPTTSSHVGSKEPGSLNPKPKTPTPETLNQRVKGGGFAEVLDPPKWASLMLQGQHQAYKHLELECNHTVHLVDKQTRNLCPHPAIPADYRNPKP